MLKILWSLSGTCVNHKGQRGHLPRFRTLVGVDHMKVTSLDFPTIVKTYVFIESALAGKAADVVADFVAGVGLPVEVAAVEAFGLQP